MIWHIFKKDWKLLWPLVALVAVTHILNDTMWFSLGIFGEPETLRRVANNFIIVPIVGIVALIAMAVHQDVLPGDRQDWLVRPIRRRDLFLAKLLFVLAAVHGPMFVVDMVQCMGMGFTFWYSIAAALSRSVYLLLSISLPVLGIAAITSTTIEMIGGLLAIFLVLVIFVTATMSLAPNSGTQTFAGNDTWLMLSFWSAVALVAVGVIIPLQYLRRSTMPARGIALGALLLAVVLSASTSWASAFAFMQWFSSDPAAAKAVAISFDPTLGKMALKPDTVNPANSVWLPLHITDLESNSVLLADRAIVHIIRGDGTILYSGLTINDPQSGGLVGTASIDDFPSRTATETEVRIHQFISLPRKIYDAVRSQPVRLEIDYFLTLTHIQVSDTIAALGGDKWVANLGHCKTKMDEDGDEIEMGCLGNFDRFTYTCANFFLESPVSAQRNPAFSPCTKSYLPYNAHFAPGAMEFLHINLSFRDPQGLKKYPVDDTQLANARVSVKAYKPVAHFTRHLVIPEIRLGDWEATTSAAATSTALPK